MCWGLVARSKQKLSLIYNGLIVAYAAWAYTAARNAFSKIFCQYPPGPCPWPHYGSMRNIGKGPMNYLDKVLERHGPIASIHMGTDRTIVVSKHDLIAKIASFNCTGKPELSGYTEGKLWSTRRTGIFSTDGRDHVCHRAFLQEQLQELQRFGQVGSTFHAEMMTMLENWEENTTGHFDSTNLFSPYITNSMWKLIAGESIENIEEKENLINIISKYVTETGRASKQMFFPWIYNMVPEWSTVSEYQELFTPLKAFVEEKYNAIAIEFKLRNREAEERPPNLIVSYLEKIHGPAMLDAPIFIDPLGSENVVAAVIDLLVLSTETVSALLNWTVLYMILNPEVQEKMHEEITRELRGEIPFADRMPRLHYLKAVISEVLRLSSVVPIIPIHTLRRKVEVNGFVIPEGVHILSNLYACHRDREFWGDQVTSFHPERFLSKPTALGARVYESRLAFLPFGTGMRSCIGRSLTEDYVALILTSLIQVYKFIPHPEMGPEMLELCLNCEQNIRVRTPLPFRFSVVQRPRWEADENVYENGVEGNEIGGESNEDCVEVNGNGIGIEDLDEIVEVDSIRNGGPVSVPIHRPRPRPGATNPRPISSDESEPSPHPRNKGLFPRPNRNPRFSAELTDDEPIFQEVEFGAEVHNSPKPGKARVVPVEENANAMSEVAVSDEVVALEHVPRMEEMVAPAQVLAREGLVDKAEDSEL